jgi:hypothetical protein
VAQGGGPAGQRTSAFEQFRSAHNRLAEALATPKEAIP